MFTQCCGSELTTVYVRPKLLLGETLLLDPNHFGVLMFVTVGHTLGNSWSNLTAGVRDFLGSWIMDKVHYEECPPVCPGNLNSDLLIRIQRCYA